jgi:hypothetical protein
MIERDEGKEKTAPEFSASVLIHDKKTSCNYLGDIKLPADSLLKDFTIDSIDDESQILVKVRVDPSDKNGSPQAVIKNHDGKDILYMLKERFDKGMNEKYFSLGAPTQDIHNFGKAVKADFSIRLDFPRLN